MQEPELRGSVEEPCWVPAAAILDKHYDDHVSVGKATLNPTSLKLDGLEPLIPVGSPVVIEYRDGGEVRLTLTLLVQSVTIRHAEPL